MSNKVEALKESLNLSPEQVFDVRLVERYIKKGLITQEDYDAYVEKIHDSSDSMAFMDTSVIMEEIQSL